MEWLREFMVRVLQSETWLRFTPPDTTRFSARATDTEKMHAFQDILLPWSSIFNVLNVPQEYHIIIF